MRYRGKRGAAIAVALEAMTGIDPRTMGSADDEGEFFEIGTAYRLAVWGIGRAPETAETKEME